MALNCRLDRNISLSQSGEGVDGCNGQDISMGVGGISSPVLVYNIDDIVSLTFEDDNRSDYSLYVDTINSVGQFYKVDHTDAQYNEELDNNKWTHTLTINISNITPLFEDILSDGTNGKYLVCFRPNGSQDYRMFGWRFGASLDYSMNITSDSLGYTITFEDISEYPLFTVDRDNFGSNNKVYTPIFAPNWNSYFCEQDGSGKHTGYAIAMYVPKVNAAGQPLDINNHLCQWSGLKQDAYKFNGITSDGGYNIIDTYTKTATFDGRPVAMLDYEKCPANVTNSIFINSKKVETINLNSTISASTFTISSSNEWMMVTDPQYVTISPVEGVNGNTQCTVSQNGVGGIDQIQFMNKVTREIVVLNVVVNIISVNNSYTFECENREIIITPSVEGCSSAYTYTLSPNNLTNSMDEYGYIHINELAGTSGTYTLTLRHSCDANEIKYVSLNFVCHSTIPIWELQTSYCEFTFDSDDNPQYTGYRISIYIDINPYSVMFGRTKEERRSDATCSSNPSTWQNVGTFCEVDSNGINTGYLVVQYQDVNPASSTYGNTREEKIYNPTQCEGADTEPMWVVDESFEPYCEQKVYEPSMIQGNTGRLVVRLIDENKYSPTFNQRQESAVTENDWDATLQRLYGDFPCDTPNTRPDIEVISESCVIVTCKNTSTTNGEKNVFGLDKNVYSSTYLQSVTNVVIDEETCPNNCSAVEYTFTWGDGTTAKTSTIEYNSTSNTYSIISKNDDGNSAVTYSIVENCNWVTGTSGQNGVTITTTPNDSFTNDRVCTITLKQDVSNKEITLTLTQKHAQPNYTFTWSDGSTAKTANIEYSSTTSSYGIISKVSGSESTVPYSISESCNWLDGTSGTSNATFTTSRNETSNDRTCNITLRQNSSNKEITLALTQKHLPSVSVYATSNKYLLDGSSASTFTIHYWAVLDGSIVTNGVTLEALPVEQDETAFTYTETSSGNDGKLYKTYTADKNTVNKQKTARFRAKYGDNYSSVLVIKQSGVDQTVLPDFDFLTFTFHWAEEGGRDLDTATFVLGTNMVIQDNKTLDELPVGFSCNGSNSIYSAATSPYLQYGGDNQSSGDECALVNWKKICDHDYISEGITTLYCDLYGNWYKEFGNGNCSVTFKTYKGQGMKHGTDDNPYVFVPSGNTTEVSTLTVSGNVRAFSSNNAFVNEQRDVYSHIGKFEYDIASKSAFFTNYMNTPSGRNIRAYGTVDGVSYTGGASTQISVNRITVDATGGTGTFTGSTFYNIINGSRYNATSYTVTISYYTIDGQLQEGFATATISNGVVTWTLEPNTSGKRREADIVMWGKEDNRDISFRLECIQDT